MLATFPALSNNLSTVPGTSWRRRLPCGADLLPNITVEITGSCNRLVTTALYVAHATSSHAARYLSSAWRFVDKRVLMWLHELWIARQPCGQGSDSVYCSLRALFRHPDRPRGLVADYGKFWMRAPFRLVVDLIRGTPVFVAVRPASTGPGAGLALRRPGRSLGLSCFALPCREIVRGALQPSPWALEGARPSA